MAMSVSEIVAGIGIDSHRLVEYWPAVKAALCRANHRDQAWALRTLAAASGIRSSTHISPAARMTSRNRPRSRSLAWGC